MPLSWKPYSKTPNGIAEFPYSSGDQAIKKPYCLPGTGALLVVFPRTKIRLGPSPKGILRTAWRKTPKTCMSSLLLDL